MGAGSRSRLAASSALAAAAFTLLGAREATAHEAGLSTGRYAWKDGRLSAKLDFARGDALRLLPTLDRNGNRTLEPEELEGTAELAAAALREVGVTLDGRPCVPGGATIALAEEDGLELQATFDCPDGARGGALRLRAGFLPMLRSGHRHVARIDADGRTTTPVLLVDAPEAEVSVGPSAAPVPEKGLFLPMLRLGIEHILTGFDHLTFLLALVLVPMRTRLLLAVVTSFTLAHSASLALAALGVWTPPSRIVEPLIAASIVFVGVENLFLRKPERRVLLTSAFGFVHGFGFAGALLKAQLERSRVPVALFAFNLGVEAGQLAVLAVVLPILLHLRKRPETRGALEKDGKAYRAASVAVAAAGAVWLALRLAS